MISKAYLANDFVDALLSATDLDLTIQNKNGETVFHSFAENANFSNWLDGSVFKPLVGGLLRAKKINLDMKDNNGHTALVRNCRIFVLS